MHLRATKEATATLVVANVLLTRLVSEVNAVIVAATSLLIVRNMLVLVMLVATIDTLRIARLRTVAVTTEVAAMVLVYTVPAPEPKAVPKLARAAHVAVSCLEMPLRTEVLEVLVFVRVLKSASALLKVAVAELTVVTILPTRRIKLGAAALAVETILPTRRMKVGAAVDVVLIVCGLVVPPPPPVGSSSSKP